MRSTRPATVRSMRRAATLATSLRALVLAPDEAAETPAALESWNLAGGVSVAPLFTLARAG